MENGRGSRKPSFNVILVALHLLPASDTVRLHHDQTPWVSLLVPNRRVGFMPVQQHRYQAVPMPLGIR